MAFTEVVEKRKSSGLVFKDGNRFSFHSVLGTVLSHKGSLVDMTPVRRNDGVLDGWEVTTAGWHYRIGKPNGNSTDGWVGFGGREGQHWIYSRLVRVGYLHYPTRAWQDVGGAPSYVRGDLSSTNDVVSVGPPGSEVYVTALSSTEWRNLWTTPGSGEVYARWRVEGKKLKEEIVVNQAARTWVANNAPPATPAASTYFGFVFQLDVSDIPRIVKGGLVQDINGDFDDDDGSSNIDIETAAQELLGFLPISSAYSVDGTTQIKLRRRIWRDADTNVYLLVGAKVTDLSAISGDIVFDPTYQIKPDSSVGVDAQLSKGNPTTNFGTYQGSDLLTGANALQFLIKWDLSSLIATSVESAVLDLTERGVCNSGSCNVYSIKSANGGWTEAGATWNTTDGASAWAGSAGCSTSGTDYDPTPVGSWTSTTAGGGGAVDSVTLAATTVLDWIKSPSNNYGLVGIGGPSSGGTLYASSDHATAAWRPKLTVAYSVTQEVSGGVRRRMRSEDELNYHKATPLREATLNVRLSSQNFHKDSHVVTAAEFRKKVDNR